MKGDIMGISIAVFVLDVTDVEERNPDHMKQIVDFHEACNVLARNRGLTVVQMEHFNTDEAYTGEGGTAHF